MRLRFGSAWVEVPALVDTGNQLWEPLSNRPVIILENKALSGILPPEVEALCRQERMDWGGLASISNPEWAGRCRLVPFSGLGIKRGLLLGLRPDEVSLFVDGKWVGGQPALVGLVNQELGWEPEICPPPLSAEMRARRKR